MRFSASTRRNAGAAVALAGALVLTFTACSSSSSPGSTALEKKSTPTPSSGPTATALFPAVTGAFGAKPTLTFPNAQPSTSLQVKVLAAGTGPVVAKSQLLIANYLGQIWRGKVFDSSFDRAQPIGAPLGVGQVLMGWDDALVGKRIGSRVLLVIPPAEGYGKAGNSAAGIKGTDTIAFVVDLVSRYSKSDIGDKSASLQKISTAPVTVTGAPGARPKISVIKGAALPTAAKATLLATGKGAVVKAGLVVMQYEATYYSGVLLDSTFARGYPVSAAIGVNGQASPFDKLIGVPVGSRVLIVTPVPTQEGGTTGAAIVVDVVAQTG